MEIGRRVTLNSLSTAIGQAITLAVAFFLTPFVLRHLPTEDYGLFVLVSSFSMSAGSISLLALGLPSALTKYIAEDDISVINRSVSSALLFFLVEGLIIALIILFTIDFWIVSVFQVSPELLEPARMSFRLLSVQIFFEFVGLPFQAIIEGRQRYDLLRMLTVITRILTALATWGALSMGSGVVNLVGINLVRSILFTVIEIIWSKRVLPAREVSIRHVSVRGIGKLARFGLQTMGFRFGGVVYRQADQYVLGMLLGVAAIGQYAVATKLQRLTAQFTGFVSTVVMPTASELARKNDRRRLQALFIYGTKYNFGFSLGIGLTTTILSGVIIEHWLGSEYVYLTNLSRLALLHLLLSPLTSVGFNMLVGMGRIVPLLVINVASSVLHLTLTLVLGHALGFSGVVLSIPLSILPTIPIYLSVIISVLGISWQTFAQEVILRVLPSAVLSSMILWSVTQLVEVQNVVGVLMIAGSGFFVFSMLFLITAVSKTERLAIRDVMAGFLLTVINTTKPRETRA